MWMCVFICVHLWRGWEKAGRVEQNPCYWCCIWVSVVLSGNSHWKVLHVGIAGVQKWNVSPEPMSCGIIESAGTEVGRVFGRKLGLWGYAPDRDIGIPPPSSTLVPHFPGQHKANSFFLCTPSMTLCPTMDPKAMDKADHRLKFPNLWAKMNPSFLKLIFLGILPQWGKTIFFFFLIFQMGKLDPHQLRNLVMQILAWQMSFTKW